MNEASRASSQRVVGLCGDSAGSAVLVSWSVVSRTWTWWCVHLLSVVTSDGGGDAG